jgi:hypothetical protein
MDQQKSMEPNDAIPDAAASAAAALRDKMTDILVPGYEVEFDPEEAEQAGAFSEDALSLHDAAESGIDLLDPSAASFDNERERP